MVVGLIQLAHKMSRAPAHASSTPPPRLPVPFFATLSLFSALSLSVCVFSVTNVARPKSRFYERIGFFCLPLPAAPRHCFVYYVFVSFLHTYFFVRSISHFLILCLCLLVGPLSGRQEGEGLMYATVLK